jgi:ubiquinone biosynthesis protein
MKRASQQGWVAERLRLLGVYEILLRYGSDALFDRGTVGDVRRATQTWLYRPEAPLERLPTPRKLRLLLQDLGPTYVKFGQIVSSRADALPSAWEDELAKLQSDVRPFSADEARAVIVSELHAPPEELYAYFDPTPLAAASLGQVHRAALGDGREVVVKVQRPGIEEKVRSDLRILGQAASTLERRLSWARELGLAGVVSEFGATLLLELDYTIEAYNARRLARNLAGLDDVRIPEVIRGLSTSRVLTMEYIEGVRATDVPAIVAAGLDPVAIGDAAVRASIKMMLIDGFFHADPHPGNVVVSLDDGVVTFLDTGMVGALTLRQRFALVNLLMTASQRDAGELARALRALSEPIDGAVVDGAGFDRDFERAVGPLMDVEEGEVIQFAKLLGRAVDLLREHHLRPAPQLSLAMKAMMQAEEFAVVLYPSGSSSSFVEKATSMTETLLAKALTRDVVIDYARREALSAVRAAAQEIPSPQEIAGSWLRQLRSGRFEVKIDASDLDARIDRAGRIANVGALAVVVSGIVIASAIAATAAPGGSLDVLRHAALVTYAAATVVAATLVVVLAWRLLRHPK